jgi:succinate dehydrogenase / fumarate reductase cytochrome b subunit
MRNESLPLSPHLQVYRFMYTMATSIIHRATGIVLSLSLLLLAVWLLALASGPESYDWVMALYSSPLGLLVAVGALAAFWYHTCAGIRHLFWDSGIGINKMAARRSAAAIAVATVVLTAVSAWLLLANGVQS